MEAGIFEETGRFLVTRFLMKNRLSAENAVLMGLGHGGAEAMLMLGFTMFAYAGMAVHVNEVGLNAAMLKFTDRDLTRIESVLNQLNAIKDFNVLNALMSLYERFLAVIFHVCMSLWAYKAVTRKMWLFPAAIAVHALCDAPAAMYQAGIIGSISVVYVIMTVFVNAVMFLTIQLQKRLPDKLR